MTAKFPNFGHTGLIFRYNKAPIPLIERDKETKKSETDRKLKQREKRLHRRKDTQIFSN